MQASVPRLVLAGTNSGCGKTTVACAVLQAFVNRGLKPAACKCGPDYIDPMFHSRIIGAKASNLDSFFFSDDTLRALLVENSRGCGVSVIEGVMGYYDGLGLTSTRASTFELAQKTQSPAVLIVNARGAALSVHPCRNRHQRHRRRYLRHHHRHSGASPARRLSGDHHPRLRRDYPRGSDEHRLRARL